MAKIGSDGILIERSLCCLQCKTWTDHRLNAAGNAYVCLNCGDHIAYSRSGDVPGVSDNTCNTVKALDDDL